MDREFDPDLKDLKSSKSKQMMDECKDNLKRAFCGESLTCSFTITSFSKGSVIINFLVAVASGHATACEELDSMNSLMNNLAIPDIIAGSFSQGRPLALKSLRSLTSYSS